MPDIKATEAGAPPEPASGLQRILTWDLASGDVALPADFAHFADRTVQIGGTFGGATVAIQGSLDGVEWATLTDPQGNGITATAARLESIMEMTTFVRPLVTGASGSTAIRVTILARRSAR